MLADGERVRASADEHPDLFWAIRGGGGNFGVVTSFLFRLHEVGTVVGGPTFWPVEQRRRGALGLPRVPAGRAARAERLLRVPHRAARRRRSRRSSTCARSAASSGATSAARRTRRAAMAPLLDAAARAAAARRRSRCRTRRCRAPSTGSTRRATSGTGAPTSSTRSPTRRSRPHAAVRRRAADDEVDDAPVPDRRRRARRRPGRHGLELPRRDAGARSSPASTPTRRTSDAIRDWTRRLLRGAAPVLGRRRLREHDDGRGPGAGPRELPRQLRPPRAASRRRTTRTTCSASTRTSSRRHRRSRARASQAQPRAVPGRGALIALSASAAARARHRHRLEHPRRQRARRHRRPVADGLDGPPRDGPRRRLRRRELDRPALRAVPRCAGAARATGTRRTPRRPPPPTASCSALVPGPAADARPAVRRVAGGDPGRRGEGGRDRRRRDRRGGDAGRAHGRRPLAAPTASRFRPRRRPGQWRPVLPAFGNDPAAWIKDVRPFLIRDPARYAHRRPERADQPRATRASSTRSRTIGSLDVHRPARRIRPTRRASGPRVRSRGPAPPGSSRSTAGSVSARPRACSRCSTRPARTP